MARAEALKLTPRILVVRRLRGAPMRTLSFFHVVVVVVFCAVAGPLDSAEAQTASSDACDQYEVAATTTPVPSQSGRALRRHYEIIQSLPIDAEVVVLGDSIAFFWPAQKLGSLFAGSKVVNLGVGGDRTQNVLWRLTSPEFKNIQPKLVIVILGTNNIQDQPCAVVAGITAVFDKIDHIWGGATKLFIEILPRGDDFLFKNDARMEINNGVRVLERSRKNFSTINVDQEIVCPPDTCSNYVADHVHLRNDGYEVLMRAIDRKYNQRQ
jgi:hypothetical protein